MPKTPPPTFEALVIAALGRIESRLAVVEAKVDGLIDVQNQMDAEQAAREEAEQADASRIDVPPDLARIFLPPKPRR